MDARNTYSILSLILLILVITPSSSSLSSTDIVTKDLLNKFCSEPTTYHHFFCFNWLSADKRTLSVSIHGLMKLVVRKTIGFGLKNQALLRDLARGSGNDTKLKESYESCVNTHGISIKELQNAQGFLNNSSFLQAFWAASKALDYAYACKDEFDGPSNEPSFVVERSEKFTDMCHISKDFTTLLD